MKKTFSSKKSAFSLIELSIVLIIIGLLIAGITGGASLIKSSELRSIMSEAKSYQVAVNSFYTQYDSYPGDTDISAGSISSHNGNRNNRIEYSVSDGKKISDGTAAAMLEGVDAWQDLRDVGAIDLNLTIVATSTSAFTPITNIPGSKRKGAGWAFDYNRSSLQNVVVLTKSIGAIATLGAPATGTTLVNNHFDATLGVAYSSNFPGGEAPYSATPGSNKASAAISAPDAFSIDSKVDDGKANAGTVLAVNPSQTVVGTTNTHCSSNATYDKYVVANGTKEVCALSFSVNI
jgi:prepilin-type N-terminal cleavage/methylation domain-containing protein